MFKVHLKPLTDLMACFHQRLLLNLILLTVSLTFSPLRSALHMASANGYLAVVEYLIQNGAVRQLLCTIICHVEPD